MITLVFDTETTGFASTNSDYREDKQPDVVQLGASLINEEKVLSEISIIIKPFRHSINPKAAEANGLTTEFVNQYGADPCEATMTFMGMLRMADRLVAHNVMFDVFLVRTLLHRCSIAQPTWGFDPLELSRQVNGAPRPMLCTMKGMTEVCGLKNKLGKPKWPKLSEAYEFVTGNELVGAHNALVDVRACVELVRYCDANNIELWRL